MLSIGEHIKQLRKSKQISRYDLCGDETELSVRQLIRIETNQSIPSLQSIRYIAEQLNLPSYYLLPDFKQLPERYLELKYHIQRKPAYGNIKVFEQQDQYITEIIENYYDDLPESEKYVVDCLQATVQLFLTNEIAYAIPVIEEKIDSYSTKSIFSTNDLSFFRLLTALFHVQCKTGQNISPKHRFIFEISFAKLLKQSELFSINNLFIYSNCIVSGLSYLNTVNDYSMISEGIKVFNDIIDKTDDYQKKTLLSMLEWKEALFINRDFTLATQKYHDTVELAKLLNLYHMLKGLTNEWQEDLEKISRKS